MNSFFEHFSHPDREYSMAPFWFLNDELKPEHLRYQLQEMCRQGVYEVVLHARKGLMIPYLSELWFERIGVILEEAEKLGMRTYIYDEDNWPSGYAGGKVFEENPDYCQWCLGVEKIVPMLGQRISVKEIPEKPLVAVIAVHRNETFTDITGQDWVSPALQHEVYVFRKERCGHRPCYTEFPYVDLLNKKATQCFVRVTHEEYKKRFPEHWGSTIKGFFTDEPGFYQNYVYQAHNLNTIPWTKEFPEYFKEKRGYELLPYMCALWDDMDELSRRIRYDYFRTLTEMYNENYFKVIRDFLQEDGLVSIGHLAMEESFSDVVQREGNFFSAMQYLDYAGIDRIDRERERITEKLGASAMHMQGKKFCMSETYGCFGWHLTLEEMKAEADWQYVQGVNKLVPHAFFSSTEDFRKTECPPSEFVQNTFWPYFKGFADYISRLSYVMSEGVFKANTLLYYPITSCWEGFQPLYTEKLAKIDASFREIAHTLLCGQVDYDIFDDASAENVLGDTSCYQVAILPCITNLPAETAQALVRFCERGGWVFSFVDDFYASLPQDDEKVKGYWKRLTKCPTYKKIVSVEELMSYYDEKQLWELKLDRRNKHIKYQHRLIEGGDLYFVINESEQEVTHVLTIPTTGNAYRLDAESGEVHSLACVEKIGETLVPLHLAGFGSALLYFKRKEQEELPIQNIEVLLPDGRVENTLKDWMEYGLGSYSGAITYVIQFEWNEEGTLMLDLGAVYEIADILVNGKQFDRLLWRPYQTNLTDVVQKGMNTLSVTVTNTPSNELTAYKKQSGLFGPIRLIYERR